MEQLHESRNVPNVVAWILFRSHFNLRGLVAKSDTLDNVPLTGTEFSPIRRENHTPSTCTGPAGPSFTGSGSSLLLIATHVQFREEQRLTDTVETTQRHCPAPGLGPSLFLLGGAVTCSSSNFLTPTPCFENLGIRVLATISTYAQQ